MCIVPCFYKQHISESTMADSKAAANIISALASYKLFQLKLRTSGADAGLALLLDEGTVNAKSRRDNLEFVPCQLPTVVNGELENYPTSSTRNEIHQ